MTGAKIGLAAIGAVALGFIFGLAWGRGTRDALPGATTTEFNSGVLTVRVNAGQALESGLLSIFR